MIIYLVIIAVEFLIILLLLRNSYKGRTPELELDEFGEEPSDNSDFFETRDYYENDVDEDLEGFYKF